MQKNLTTKLTFFFFFLTLLFSCRDNNSGQIPEVYVNITLDLNKAEYAKLAGIGNYIYINGGVSGIIVYRNGIDEFLAYDRACPHDPHCGRIFVNADNSFFIDSLCCKSNFSIYNGAPLNGPAKKFLKQYKCFYNQVQNSLTITN